MVVASVAKTLAFLEKLVALVSVLLLAAKGVVWDKAADVSAKGGIGRGRGC